VALGLGRGVSNSCAKLLFIGMNNAANNRIKQIDLNCKIITIPFRLLIKD
jgi:hypothetical protein